LHFNLRDPVVGDVRVRHAIAYGIDRARLIGVITHGTGIPTDSDQSILGWAYDAHLPHIAYNPVASARLLDAAGWRVGADGIRSRNGSRLALQLSIAPAGVDGSREAALMIQGALRAIGIEVPIKEYSPGLMFATRQQGGILMSGRFQMAYDAWWVQGPDPDDSLLFGCDQFPPVGTNFYFWCNTRADAAMRDGLSTFDKARRIRDYAIVQRELVRDLPRFPLWQLRHPAAYAAWLHGVSPSPAGSTFWNAWSWWIQR
jgi:peptide/nickel transport system substrate-binding protein